MIWKLRSLELGAEIFTEIKSISEIEYERPDIPIPAVSTKAGHQTQQNPKDDFVFAQSGFPIYFAISVQHVYR